MKGLTRLAVVSGHGLLAGAAAEQAARDFMARHRICAVPRPTCLLLDSGANDADANANSIVEHFRIGSR
jgi:hypothetical protein